MDATPAPQSEAAREPAATDIDDREAALEKLWSLPPAELSAALEAMSGGARPKLVTMDLDDGDLVEAEPPPQRSVVPMPKPAASHPPPPPSAALAAPAPIETLRAPAPASVGPRMSAVDPLDMLFDGLYDLVFCDSSLAAARFCVAKLLQAVEAGAAVMHHLDGATGDYVIAHAEGAHAERVIGARSDSSDWSLDAVARNLKPFSMTYSEESGPRLIARHATLKARRRVLVVPVIVHGRAFAALEIIDPKADLEPRVEAAAIYAASRYAEYVREHGVELPPAPASRTQLR